MTLLMALTATGGRRGGSRGRIQYRVRMCAHLLSCVQFSAAPGTVARQAPLPMEFSRQEYWSGAPFTTPGDLPDPGIEPLLSLASLALAGDSLPLMPPGKSQCN